MKQSNIYFLILIIAAITISIPFDSTAQPFYSGPVGIGWTSGKTAEAPLHIYTANSGTNRLVTMHETQPASSTSGYQTRHYLLFRYGSNGSPSYPTDIEFIDGIGGPLLSSGSTADAWWKRSSSTQSWGNGDQTTMTLSNGNLGIGVVPTSTYKLDVTGAVRTTGNLYVTGNVGIGTTTPTEKLEVNGKIKATNLDITGTTYFTGNVGIGTSASSEKLVVYNNSSTQAATQYANLSTGTTNGFLTGVESAGNGLLWLRNNSYIRFGTDNTERMRIYSNGNVGIGTTATSIDHKLEVKGKIRTQEVIVTLTGWSDFVFAPGYQLRPLSEVETHIQEKGHLPEIPSEAEAIENGVGLAEMNVKLLQKVEELTLYIIEQSKDILQLKEQVANLEKESFNK